MVKLLSTLPAKPQPVWARFGGATFIVFVCCLIQAAIYATTGSTGLFVLLPGIFLTGFVFDRGSAFWATAIGIVFTIWLTPLGRDTTDLLPIGLFALTGLIVALVSEVLRKTLDRLQASEQVKDLLLRELAHRTKNNMAIMASLLRLQTRGADGDTRRALEAAARRIGVMAQLNDHLKPHGEGRIVRMGVYLQELIFNVQRMELKDNVRLHLRADDIWLPESHALPIAIAVNELVTNSYSHAFPHGRHGEVEASLRQDGELILVVEDNGVGCTDDQLGQGSRLTQLMVQQLQGTVSRRPNGPGCRVEIRIPSPPAISEAA